MRQPPFIIISTGEPAGVGVDVTLQALNHLRDRNLRNILVVADQQLLEQRAQALGLDLNIVAGPRPPHPLPGGQVNVLSIPTAQRVVATQLDARNSRYVLKCIDHCVDLCIDLRRQQIAAAMVTAPVHKGIINAAGIPFRGHTEWLAARCQATTPVMMLSRETLRVCLATTHVPLCQVASEITTARLRRIVQVIHRDLTRLYQIAAPRIGVCGLNPHAGEDGHLGREEIEIIEPLLADLRRHGLNLIGPLPADTAFTQSQLSQLDVVLAMYHDQGLPVIKHSGFGKVVNITLGLPIIRTSVDHGTALSLAASGRADASSMLEALRHAQYLATRTAPVDTQAATAAKASAAATN